MAEPTVTLEHWTVRCAPDSVRCANGSKAANGRLRQIRKEIRTGQCRVPQAGSCELAALGKKLTAYGYNSPDCLVCTGQCPVSQRSAARSALDTWPSQRSGGGTGLSGVHRTVSGAPTAPRLPIVGFAK
jgi:hypothetical protein